MNWTGGGLQRHSITKSSGAQRQKEHFARVQQRLRGGGAANKQSPAKFSVRDFDARNSQNHQRGLIGTRQGPISNRSQSLQPSSTLLPGPRLSRSPYSNQTAKSQTAKPHGSPVPRPHRPVQIKTERNRVPDGDYNATPPPRPTKRKREASELLSNAGSIIEQRPGEESLSEKKRKLLRKGDWIGVTMQKPLQLAFASPRDGQNIGRRRKVTDGHRPKYQGQQRIVSPFAARRRANNSHDIDAHEQPATSRQDVRISIDGRAVAPGMSSSSAPRRHGSLSTAGRRSMQAASTDSMLLDKESIRGVQSRQAMEYEDSPAANSQIRQTSSVGRASTSILFEPGSHDWSWEGLESSQLEQGWAGVTAYSLEQLQSNFQGQKANNAEHPNTTSRPHTRSSKVTPTSDLRRSLRPGQVVFSSSSASIHHPRPKTSKRSVLLSSEASDIAASNTAQVGKSKSIVPSSQVLEHEMWKTWIAPEDGDEPEDNGFIHSCPTGAGSISPGVSVMSAPRLASKHIPVVEEGDEDISELEVPDAYEDEEDDISEHIPDISIPSRTEHRSQPLRTNSARLSSAQARAPPSRQAIPQQIEKQPHPSAVVPTIQKIQTEEDQDAVWRKFVFGSSSDEVDPPEPELNPSVNGMFQGSPSMIAHPPTEMDLESSGRTRSDRPTTSSTSYLMNTSPAVPKINSWEPHRKSDAADHFHIGDGQASIQALNGSDAVSTSDFAPTTMADDGTSPSKSSDEAHTGSNKPRKRVLFTKPRPFVGRHAPLDPVDEEPVYIGRMGGGDQGTSRVRAGDKSGYMAVNEDEQDELESIEDD